MCARQVFIKGTNIPKYREVAGIIEKYCEAHKCFHGPQEWTPSKIHKYGLGKCRRHGAESAYIRRLNPEIRARDNAITNKSMKRAYQRRKQANDIEFLLKNRIRSRISNLIKRDKRPGHIVDFLGCNFGELKNHLESLFQDGMTWANYGKNGWHIDHIIPLDSFDLTDPVQYAKAVHFTNLQPLWAKQNLSKGNKI